MILIIALSVNKASAGSGGQLPFQKTFGGTSVDYAGGVRQTSDGGYVIAGYTQSFGAGGLDAYVVKLDSIGFIEWPVTFGGSTTDICDKIELTADGGFILTGYTQSFGAGSTDIYLLKVDKNGNLTWSKTIGGSSQDEGFYTVQTADGGYITAGYTQSFGAGTYDAYLVKTDSVGTLQWSKTYGGADWDYASFVQQTTDGGFILTGYTRSFGSGGDDIYMIKTDTAGNLQWSETIGGINDEFGISIQQTSDKGYIITGTTYSFGAGLGDVFLNKIDSVGNLLWFKTMGGSNYDYGESVKQTSDGGYIIGAKTLSFGSGGSDAYLLKTDSAGTLEWSKAYGGTGEDGAYNVQQTTDDGFALSGITYTYGQGAGDAYFLKTLLNGSAGCDEIVAGTIVSAQSISVFSTATVVNSVSSIQNNPFTVSMSAATVGDVIDCDLVWPGDLNGDFIANQYDMLGIGLHYSETGPARIMTYQNTLWNGYRAESWQLPDQKNGKNRNHADCDGNGNINNLDILAIDKNFGMTHTKTNSSVYNPANPDLYFEVLTPEVAPGVDVEVKIMAGKDSISLYGIGYEIELDPSLIDKTSMSLTWTNSWMGQAGVDLLTFDTLIPTTGKVFAALVRNDHVDVKAFGEIARLKFKIRSDTSFADTINLKMLLSTDPGGAVTATGDTLTFNAVNDTSVQVIDGMFRTINPLSSIQIYPVPSRGYFDIFSLDINRVYDIALRNSLGQTLFHKQIANASNEVIDIHFLPDGMYFINVVSGNYFFNQKLVLVRGN